MAKISIFSFLILLFCTVAIAEPLFYTELGGVTNTNYKYHNDNNDPLINKNERLMPSLSIGAFLFYDKDMGLFISYGGQYTSAKYRDLNEQEENLDIFSLQFDIGGIIPLGSSFIVLKGGAGYHFLKSSKIINTDSSHSGQKIQGSIQLVFSSDVYVYGQSSIYVIDNETEFGLMSFGVGFYF